MFHVPLALASIDPHAELSDPAAALFASAIADPVFAFVDAAGNAYPALVQGMLVRDAGVTTVKPSRRAADGARRRALDARDLVFLDRAIARARRSLAR